MRFHFHDGVVAAAILSGLGACSPDSLSAPDRGALISANRMTGGESVTYQYVAFPGDEAGAANGDRIELSGDGTFSLHPNSATSGNGVFTHSNATGTVLASGTWTATELLSFQSYGPSPQFPPTFEAGKAVIRIHLSPAGGGPGADAIFTLGCVLPGGEADDPGGAFEGIRVAVEGGPNFNRQEERTTIFIRQ